MQKSDNTWKPGVYLSDVHSRVTAQWLGWCEAIRTYYCCDHTILINFPNHGTINEINKSMLIYSDTWMKERKKNKRVNIDICWIKKNVSSPLKVLKIRWLKKYESIFFYLLLIWGLYKLYMGRSYLSKDQTVFDSHRKREDTSKKQNKAADAFLVMYIHKIMLFNNFMAIITEWEKISFSKSLSSTSFFFILTFFILKQKQFFCITVLCDLLEMYWKSRKHTQKARTTSAVWRLYIPVVQNKVCLPGWRSTCAAEWIALQCCPRHSHILETVSWQHQASAGASAALPLLGLQ